MNHKLIYVFADWIGLDGPILMGELTVNESRGNEIFTFSYTNDWLLKYALHSIDPELSFYSGKQYSYSKYGNFGMFLDSSPDRWGRVLMKRRYNNIRLQESDYLLCVYDGNRMGGLRLNIDFVNNEQSLDLARSVTKDFRIKLKEADSIINQIVANVRDWRNIATANGVSRREQSDMENAFRVAISADGC